ncbi:flagellar basal-body MS-ring/collar protein FliF, partial [Nitrospinota bacterium]
MNYLIQLAAQFWEIIANMSAARRIAVLMFMGVVISSLVGLMMWSARPDYQVLFSGLSQDDANTVVTRLREQRIPFLLESNGTVIKVPGTMIHETRLSLAEESLPMGGGLGFEIFDRSSLGVTDFVQKVNFLRALQGELARTIIQLRTVSSARVHIVMPDRSLFAEERREPSASVVVGLSSGGTLPKTQVNSIVHLVASAVEGLDAKNITVVDTRGNIMAGGEGDAEAGLLSATQLEFEVALERRMERRIESMLAKVVGAGKAVARVDLNLNMQRVERTRETFDPEKQVERSVRNVKESSQSGAGAAGGVPGVQSNVPASERSENVQQGAGAAGQKSSRTSSTINYEIDKTIERIVEPVGEIRRISAAVMVDGTYTGTPPQFQARTQAEIGNFTQLVSAAVGLNAQRGDTVRVVSVPFQAPAPPEEVGIVPVSQQAFVVDMIQYVVGIIALVLIFFFVVRPILNWISSMELRAAAPTEGLPAGMEGMVLPGGMPGAGLLEEAAPPPKTAEEIENEEAGKIYEQVYEY